MTSSLLAASTLPVQDAASIPTLSLPRLYLLRFGYLFVAVGLAVTRWPKLLTGGASLPLMEGVVTSMLVAMSLLFLLGIRYPVQMIPMLLFETAWKVIWLGAIALPLWMSGQLDEAAASVVFSCSLVAVVIAVIPWRYVIQQYLTKRGDRWSLSALRAGHDRY